MHRMKLWNDSFEAIKDGWKTIEMRLNDEKRSQSDMLPPLIEVGASCSMTLTSQD